MSDYDIVIKLDPGQPVAGAKAVTDGVAGIENQSKKTQAALDGAASSAKSLKSIDFKQAAAGANQIFGLLNEKLKITDNAVGSVIGSAVKFGAAGAQVAGPWGAAIGAIGGALVDLSTQLDSLADRAKNLIDAKEMMDAWNNSIAYGASEVHRLTSGFEALHKTLDGLAQSRALATTAPGLLAVQQYNEEIARQKELLEKIRGPQRDYEKNVDSLRAMLNSGKITSKEFNSEIADLNKEFESDAPKQYVDKLKEARDLFSAFVADQRRAGAQGSRASSNGGYSDSNYAFDVATSQAADDMEAERQRAIAEQSPSNLDAEVANMTAMEERSKELAANTRKWNEELKAANDNTAVIADQLKSAATTLSDTLIDAANGADVSWGSVLKNIVIGFEKAIVQALILKALTGSGDGSKGAGIGGGYGGLFGLMGFASGGVIGPSGPGTTDTQTVMFRKSPSETVRIQTPSQEAAYRTGGSSGSSGGDSQRPLQVVLEDRRDPRALLKTSEFERAVLDVQRRYGRQ